MGEKKYRLEIDPRILELLGPNLYTNIYYVLAELIANSYDADAHNVYVIVDKNSITVEDDGHGMSYDNGEVEKYLGVAKLSRTDDSNSYTPSGREKMGRKGIGKLAALSVSENVRIYTVSNSEKSGFILSRHPANDGSLTSIPDNEIAFKKVKGNGTAVIMINPEYKLHKTPDVVRKNLMNIFPLVNPDFKIHVICNGQDYVTDHLDAIYAKELGAIIMLGDEFHNIGDKMTPLAPDLKENREFYTKKLSLKNSKGLEKEYTLEVKGWIGAYKSTKGRKRDMSDFPDNFISLYSHSKMGEFNILPKVGKNKVTEVYVVGQLFVDLFELSELPDMALSNRQGYKSDDERYVEVIRYVQNELLPDITDKRSRYATLKKNNEKQIQLKHQKDEEQKLKISIDNFKANTVKGICSKLLEGVNLSSEALSNIVENTLNENLPNLGVKSKIDRTKKKILISQTKEDKAVSDLVYHFLCYNGVPEADILYSNCDYEISRIPEGMPIFDYLRDFFVNSYSDQKIYVIFITSEHIIGSFGTMAEIGAAWITRADHKIINIGDFRPEKPLDDVTTWQNTIVDKSGNISMDSINQDLFCIKIEKVCESLGYKHRSREENMALLKTLILTK